MAESEVGGRAVGPVRAVVYCGSLVGLFHFGYATLRAWLAGRPLYLPWQGVASALPGREAFSAGAGPVALGLLCHFVVAFSIVTPYMLASRRLGRLTRNAGW